MGVKINGLLIDADAIGAGVYQIICDADMAGIVAFGMVPKEFIDLVERHVRVKVVEIAAQQRGVTPEEFRPFVDQKRVDQTVAEAVKAISSAIYKAAAKAGRMIV